MINANYILIQFVRKSKEARANEAQRKIASMKNYNSWKDPDYNYLKKAMNFVYLTLQSILITFLSFISLLHISLPNFILAIVFLFYTLLVEFTLVKAQVKMKIKFMQILFRCTQIVILIIIIVVIFNGLPVYGFPLLVVSPVLYDKILIFVILQLLYDVIMSDNYEATLQKYLLKNSIKVFIVITY